MSLEVEAARFLRWEKRCPLIFWERSPREFMCGRPDMLGVTQSRYMLEIEIKRSLSDFRANKYKRHMQNRCSSNDEVRAFYDRRAPRQFWFLTPNNLTEKVANELPDWAGLLSTDEYGRIFEHKRSPVNRSSERLSMKECVKLGHFLGAQLLGLMSENHFRRQGPKCPDCTFMDDFFKEQPDYVNFQI